jgi:hypothetical protein
MKENNNNTISIGNIIPFAGRDWRVLDIQNDKTLIISEKIIEQRPYNVDYTDITWENCTLRKYLNGEFLNKFSETEQNRIVTVTNRNNANLWYDTSGGNNTTDRIFLLSLDEVDEYFGNSGDYQSRRRKNRYNDEYWLDTNGYYLSNDNDKSRVSTYNGSPSWWWLRSPGGFNNISAFVNDDGDVFVEGTLVVIDSCGVRPALWLQL